MTATGARGMEGGRGRPGPRARGPVGLLVPLVVTLGWLALTGRPATVAAQPNPTPTSAAVSPTLPGGAPDAGAIYRRDCAVCHGAGGGGGPGAPAIRSATAGLVDYELTTGRMPLPAPGATVERRAPRYDALTARSLVEYVTGLGDRPLPPPPAPDLSAADVANGGGLFRLQCAPCHQSAGRGGALVTGNAPALDRATPGQVAEAIRSGPGPMPAFGTAAMSDAEVADVTAYVQQLQHPDDRGGLALDHLGPLPEGAVAWIGGLGLVIAAAILLERSARS